MKENKLYKNKEWLYQKYWIENLTQTEVANIFNISQTAILKWMRKHDIKTRKACIRKGFKHSQDTKEKMRKSHMGIKCPHLISLNKKRCSNVPISEEQKQKQRESILKYWNSKEGIIQKKKLSKINRKWAKEHPEEKIKAAKNGHKNCPKISSLEIQVQNILKKNNIEFIPQYEYKLGFIDIFIEPNKAIFVNGNYWHNYPYGTEKDKKQLKYLKQIGFNCLIIWEHEIYNQPRMVLNKTNKFIQMEI